MRKEKNASYAQWYLHKWGFAIHVSLVGCASEH